MSALGPLSLDLYLPALPQLSIDLDASDALAQLTLSACLVGLAVGQLIGGPLSDRFGRRRPLLIGLSVYTLLSALSVFAPTIELLIALRAAQGFAGAVGIVLARAIVRDVFSGRDVAKILSVLLLISGMAPLIAPLLGGQLLTVMNWRGVFAVLTMISLLIFALVFFAVPETLDPRARHAGGLRAISSGFGRVLREPLFASTTAVLTLGGAAVFTYISASSFVLQNEFALTPQQFSIVFAANSAGVGALGYLNALLVRSVHPRVLLVWGATMSAAGSIFCLAASVLHWGFWPLVAGLFVTVASYSLVTPNATALGLSMHGRDAGTASAVIGTGPFLAGAALSPFALLGAAPAVTMCAIITVAMGLAWALSIGLVRPISARLTSSLPHEDIAALAAAEPADPSLGVLDPEDTPDEGKDLP